MVCIHKEIQIWRAKLHGDITTIHSPACGKDFIFSRGRTVVCVSPEDLVNVSVSTFQTLVYIVGCKLLELATAVLERLPR